MSLALIERAKNYCHKIAVSTPEAIFTYEDLLHTSHQIASTLLQGKTDLEEARIAFIVPSGFDYVAIQWAIWRAGGIAVPLCISHPQPELEYVINDSGVDTIIPHPNFEKIASAVALKQGCGLLSTLNMKSEELTPLPIIDRERRALILYTSGTTGKPKGVVITHKNIESQVTSLVSAWEWTECDRILQVLPLHHIHGIINVLTCALWVGAQCHILPKFSPEIVWDYFSKGDLTLFMAVPTIYVKLINHWHNSDSQTQKIMSDGCKSMRLMVSGSAALPVKVLEEWQSISSHFLLERYGMTEIGMALSNPLKGIRQAGYVGQPLPHVEVRLVDEEGEIITTPDTSGEIQVRGDNVFKEYWHKPEATEKAFQDGWFRTGDLATLENGSYRILGRLSVDIIKTGGYKVSALEIEETLRNHPLIKDCAVVGIEDIEWGQRVCIAVILSQETPLTLEELRNWGKERLAVYKIPSKMLIMADFPRNAMGKITKPSIAQLFNSTQKSY